MAVLHGTLQRRSWPSAARSTLPANRLAAPAQENYVEYNPPVFRHGLSPEDDAPDRNARRTDSDS